MQVEIKCPEKLLFFASTPCRLKGARGGRGAGKSWAVADTLLLKALECKRRILCGREYQNTISDSVHQLLIDRIENYGLEHLFTITTNEIICKTTGSTFEYRGLHHNITELKSFEGVDIFWGEESVMFSQKSLSILTPTIRKANSELWFTWNTGTGDEPIEQLFQHRDDAILAFVNYWDNPWFPDVLREEMEHDKVINPAMYRHVWCGEPGASGQFFPEFVKHLDLMRVKPYKIPQFDLNLYGSMDYGDGSLPDSGATSFGLWNVDKKTGKPTRLFTYYKRGMYADAYAREIVASVSSLWETGGTMPHAVYADPSIFVKRNSERGTSRAIADYFREVGLNMVAANNDRQNGWRVMRNAFCLDAEGAPNSFFWDGYNDEYEDCIPRLQCNEKRPDDAMKGGNQEHLCDDVRYGLVAFMANVKPVTNHVDHNAKARREQKVMGYGDILKPRMLSLSECY